MSSPDSPFPDSSKKVKSEGFFKYYQNCTGWKAPSIFRPSGVFAIACPFVSFGFRRLHSQYEMANMPRTSDTARDGRRIISASCVRILFDGH